MCDNISYSIREYSDKLFRFINRIVRDREQALDLVQEIYLIILSRYEKIRDKSKLKSYLFRTGYNLALNFKRDTARRTGKLESENMSPRLIDRPDALMEAMEQKERMEDALGKLAEKQQEVIRLRFYGDLKISEIAGIMKISEGTVKVHIARGLQNLKRELFETIGNDRK